MYMTYTNVPVLVQSWLLLKDHRAATNVPDSHIFHNVSRQGEISQYETVLPPSFYQQLLLPLERIDVYSLFLFILWRVRSTKGLEGEIHKPPTTHTLSLKKARSGLQTITDSSSSYPLVHLSRCSGRGYFQQQTHYSDGNGRIGRERKKKMVEIDQITEVCELHLFHFCLRRSDFRHGWRFHLLFFSHPPVRRCFSCLIY